MIENKNLLIEEIKELEISNNRLSDSLINANKLIDRKNTLIETIKTENSYINSIGAIGIKENIPSNNNKSRLYEKFYMSKMKNNHKTHSANDLIHIPSYNNDDIVNEVNDLNEKLNEEDFIYNDYNDYNNNDLIISN